jgi:bacillithiol system protein YtxJ
MNELTTQEQLAQALQDSNERRILVFKHSTTCPISAAAYNEVTRFAANHSTPVYLVKVIEDRPLSNYIAEHLQVRHASPQALVVENGEVVWNTSHYDITESALDQAVE